MGFWGSDASGDSDTSPRHLSLVVFCSWITQIVERQTPRSSMRTTGVSALEERLGRRFVLLSPMRYTERSPVTAGALPRHRPLRRCAPVYSPCCPSIAAPAAAECAGEPGRTGSDKLTAAVPAMPPRWRPDLPATSPGRRTTGPQRGLSLFARVAALSPAPAAMPPLHPNANVREVSPGTVPGSRRSAWG